MFQPGSGSNEVFQVPDTGFSCDGQVEGGKYADPGAECQVGNTPYLRYKVEQI